MSRTYAPEDIAARIRDAIIGDGVALDGPYGPRRLTYADYTASGQALTFVEEHIRRAVLPMYANTHSESSATGRQTAALREAARSVIHRAVGGATEHLVIFCGSGSTAAIAKLVRLLVPSRSEAPVVLVGPYEHHSNELQWRESGADVVPVGADDHGRIDASELRLRLAELAGRRRVIGAFSAASNVTGIRSETAEISAILHEYGALAVWDFTAAAPSVRIDVAAEGLDAIAFSPHKFVGGPQTAGVLVLRRDLIGSTVPTTPGGGTIAFVDPSGALYADDPVAREEGGTPPIVESIRAAAVVALQQLVGADYIGRRGEHWWHRARERWSANPAIEILGDLSAPRLPIVSLRVHRDGRVLHHNFVVALLNDLFGIQARGGCSCAGPYGHLLLCITPRRSAALRAQAAAGYLGVKPGWTRINFSYFISDTVGQYLIDAIDLVARHGHRLLPAYRLDPRTGHWQHHMRPAPEHRDIVGALLAPAVPHRTLPESVLALQAARTLLLAGPDRLEDGPSGLPEQFEELREFHLPPSCVAQHSGSRQ